jgi:hypothetical protein
MHGGPGVATSPVVDVSTNQGVSFAHSYVLPEPGGSTNWGDRDFIAVGANGELFVTWDYGPSDSQVQFSCPPNGSCSFTHGDLNIVVQHSTDGGASWSSIQPVSPGYPDSGADTAPILAQPNGTLDMLFQQMPTNPSTLALSPGSEWFTRSTNDGVSWSKPVEVGASVGTVSLSTWWIDGALSVDAAGNLYATWDTQHSSTDTGWLSISTDGGSTWTKPVAVAASTSEELTESAAVGKGLVDVAWQTLGPKGYASFIRPYSVAKKAWLTSAALRVSTQYGLPSVWPGDTFGLQALPNGTATKYGKPVFVSWGSDVSTSSQSQIFGSVIDLSAPGFAVGNVTGTASSAAVGVRWAKPWSGGALIAGYSVYYSHLDGTGLTKACTTSATTLDCHVKLPVGRDLELFVKAQTALGTSTALAQGPGPRSDWWWLWNKLFAKDTIQPDECMWSFNRAYKFCMSPKGDLTEVRLSDGATLWSLSSKIGSGSLVPGSFATFQTDGNLAVYPPASQTAIWSTGTTTAGGLFTVQTDGNLVIYNASNVAVCARFGTAPCPLQ